MSSGITAIILTYNEERHITRCIASLGGVVERVCVVDCYSTDRTVELARAAGAEVYQNEWSNHATQFQWALDNCDVSTAWTLRIDADEYLSAELAAELGERVPGLPPEVGGMRLRRCIVFMGRPIRHGFFYPLRILRLWRTGSARMEQRWMDEHIVLNPTRIVDSAADLLDENLNDTAWWLRRLDGYAAREMFALVSGTRAGEKDSLKDAGYQLEGRAAFKRALKDRVYSRLPTGVRSSMYFFYRYFLGLGFLDGREGFYFHFLQGYVYRTLVDLKLEEMRALAKRENSTIEAAIRSHYGVEI